MRKYKISLRLLSLLVLISAIAVVFSGCKQTITPKKDTFYGYFDTVSTVSDYSGGSEESFRENLELAKSRLKFYHELFDIYHEYDSLTNLATVNRLAGEGEVTVSPELIEFLEYAIEMHELTGGNMNIAMGSVLKIWHEYREAGVAVPTDAELREAAEHTDIKNLVIDKQKCTVRFLDPEMSLDVGAIAKGYAVERVAEELIARGADSYVLDVGGNLRIIGHKPDGSTWRTAVENPDFYSDNPYVYYLDVADTSVVTSGNYQRFYIVDGVRYHHIINKDTLMPADYFASVTIITKDSALADTLTTALFNMDYESGVELLSTLDGVSCVWVTNDGEVKTYGL